MMPGMNGFEFIAELRQREANRAIPIVVLTAKTSPRKTASGSTATWSGSCRRELSRELLRKVRDLATTYAR